jgi:hypothetical protein
LEQKQLLSHIYYYKLNEKEEKVYYIDNKIVGINGTAYEMKKYLVSSRKLSYSKANKIVEQIKLYKIPIKKEKEENKA